MAEKLGIDLIWFGVILGVNMQTSFMHPPFGFALFYLRSVAPKESYIDRVTGKRMEPVTTGQIYWGAVPFVVIQVIMVLLVISFPPMVMHYKGTAVDGRSEHDQDQVPQIEMPPLGFWQAAEAIAQAPHATETTPELSLRGFAFWVSDARRSAAGARADHEAVVGVFGNLPPQILVGAVGLHRVDRLLEVGVLARDFGPQLVGRLQAGFQHFVGVNGRSCVPPATRRFSADGFCMS